MSDLSRTRARLTKAQVISIFQSKGKSYPANALAIWYGVSEKAVRDIWKGRTWSKETRRLETSGLLQVKKRGQPTGVTDKEQSGISEITLASPVKIDDGSALKRCELVNESGKAWITTCILQVGTENFTCGNLGVANAKETPVIQAKSGDSFVLQHANTWAQFAHHQVSVDDQLHEWNQSMWLDAASQEADPFLHDWRPTSCDSF
jgi:hypothetical protein